MLLQQTAFAQVKSKRNTAYFELLGNGLTLSANYERYVFKKPGLAWHIGVGLGSNLPAIPLGFKYVFPFKNVKSNLEIGFGVTFLESDGWKSTFGGSNSLKNPYQPGFIPSIGYRHQTKYGLMWRANFLTVYNKQREPIYFGGLSIGWHF